MRSGVGVRHGRSGFVLVTNLIIHHSIADIFDQTIQFVRILDVVEETLDLPLLCQWLEFSENFFQPPNDPCLSDTALELGGPGLLFQTLSPASLLEIILRNRRAE